MTPSSQLQVMLAEENGATPSVRVVQALSEHGALSATQLARITGLAKSTISTALTSLRASAMVIESSAAEKDRGAGRPATTITLNPAAGTCVGVLLGGEHIQVIVADVTHAVISDVALPMKTDYSPQEAVTATSRLIGEAYREHRLSLQTMLGVGIAVAGPINPRDGRVLRASGVPTWSGVNIKHEFQRVLKCPVIAENESNCSAIAELMWGAAVGRQDFIFLTMDLAIGGAVVANGQLVSGNAGAAGEFGHICINPDGPLCRCGNHGCLELYAGLKEPLGEFSRQFGQEVTIDEVISLARGGNLAAQTMIEQVAHVAGQGLGIIASVVNPGLVVVGGRLALARELLLAPLEASFNRHSLVKRSELDADARTQVLSSAFSGRGACLGAVGLVLRAGGRTG
ncbi:MAG: hypothetical protein JWR39_2742 [Devosia sp.]|nr:hypothetical protein [Devosia sp.]